MELFGLVIFFSLPVFGIFMMIYARKLNAIAEYSKEHNVDVFGKKYTNVYQLLLDVSFFNALWASKCYSTVEEESLAKLVCSAHKMLRGGMMVCLAFFFIPIIGRVVELAGGT